LTFNIPSEETMQHNSGFAKFLRVAGIILLALTAAVTLMGGIGTVCAALFTEKYAAESASMAKLVGWGWLYTIFMLVTTAIGVLMVRAVVLLVKAAPTSYRDTIISLVAGVVVGFIHIFTSRALRGASMPVDMVTYSAVFTLMVFLVFRIPGVWSGVDFTRGKNDPKTAGGAAAMVFGLICLTIQYLAGPSHTWALGINWADYFHTALQIVGWGLMLLGGLLALRPSPGNQPQKAEAALEIR
jgi:hypothetical protein